MDWGLMAEFITFKRWLLRPGCELREVSELVRDVIAPAYARLGCRRLGLWQINSGRSYLATQHWESRHARDDAVNSPTYPSWLTAYQPALSRWHALMVLEDEWEVEDVLHDQ